MAAPTRSIEDLTARNVAIIAEMEKAAGQFRTRGERVADQHTAGIVVKKSLDLKRGAES